MIGAVGEVLCLKAYCTALGQCRSVGAGAAAAVVAGIALNAGLGGVALHGASAYRIHAFYSQAEFTGFTLVEHPAMVISVAVLGLLALFNTLAYLVRSAEIKRSALNLINCAKRNGCIVDWNIMVGVDCQVIIQNRERVLLHAVQGKVSMLCQANYGLLVSCCLILYGKFVVIGKAICYVYIQIAGESLSRFWIMT